MKSKTLTLIVGMFLMFSLTSVISAQEEAERVGIYPDSPFYGLDVAIDNIILQISNSPNTGLRIAEERLNEIQVMVQENKSDMIEEAEKNRQKAMEMAQSRAGNGEEGLRVQEMLQEHVQKLEQIRNNISQEAKEGFNKAIESSEKGIESIKDKIKDMEISNGQ